MSKGRGRDLSDEDRILWVKVARTTVPLRGRGAVVHDEPDLDFATAIEVTALPASSPPKPPAHPRSHNPVLDRPTHDKLKKGRVAIDGKVDLHGLTQANAHGLLLSFLRRGHAEGRRHVLVVTGKGASYGSEGVLKRAVPDWLRTPPFRPLVSGWSEAARNHGGAGALYIRLARNPSLHN